MNQIDFSDINKFFTSLGLILIGIAILIPWYINQNLSLLLIDSESFNNTIEAAKVILTKQQSYLLFISNNLLYIIIPFILLGIVFITVGLIRWYKRQIVINQIQDEELKSRKGQNISKEEKREQIENTEELKEIPSEEKESAIKKYIALEERIFLKLAKYYTVNYITQNNIRIGQFEYDIILKSKYIQKRVDLILEVKYFKSKVSLNRFIELTRRFLLEIANYEQTQQRYGVIPILLLVFESDSLMKESERFKSEMMDLAQTSGVQNLRILYRLEQNIPTIEAPDLIIDKN